MHSTYTLQGKLHEAIELANDIANDRRYEGKAEQADFYFDLASVLAVMSNDIMSMRGKSQGEEAREVKILADQRRALREADRAREFAEQTRIEDIAHRAPELI